MKSLSKILLAILFSIFSSQLFSQPDDPHRGMFVDKFINFFNQDINSGLNRLDTANSTLGVWDATAYGGIGGYRKENELLEYAAENHFTYLLLYDLHKIWPFNPASEIPVAWDSTTNSMRDLSYHLCRFINKAKNKYCITQIGAAGSSKDFFDNFNLTTSPYLFSNQEKTSPVFNPNLLFVENPNNSGNPVAEITKYFLRLTNFSTCPDCQANIDILDLEIEFWNQHSLLVDF